MGAIAIIAAGLLASGKVQASPQQRPQRLPQPAATAIEKLPDHAKAKAFFAPQDEQTCDIIRPTDVQPFRNGFVVLNGPRFSACVFDEVATEITFTTHPTSIAVLNDELFVGFRGKIARYDGDLNRVDLFMFPGIASSVVGVGTDLYALDSETGSVQVLDMQGQLQRQFSVKGRSGWFSGRSYVTAISYDPLREELIAVDFGKAELRRYQLDGTRIGVIRTSPFSAENMSRPNAVVVSDDGRLFVTDVLNNKIFAFSQDGQLITTFGGWDANIKQLRNPVGLAIVHERLYVADFLNNRIKTFTLQGDIR